MARLHRQPRTTIPVLGPLAAVIGVVALAASSVSAANEVPAAPAASSSTPVSELARAASQCAAIIEGKVQKVTFAYDELSGPRTNFHIAVQTVHAGTVPPEIVLSQFGGFLPSGKFAGATHVPMLAENTRYLIMLQSDAVTGFWSGVVADFAFAIEEVDGREVLVGQQGEFMTEMSLLGPRFSAKPLFEQVRFNGTTYPTPAKLTGPHDNISAAPNAASAALAIKQAAEKEGVVIGGNRAAPIPPWQPWNKGPISASASMGGAQ